MGKFKEINMVSASVIAAISNHLKDLELPFSFAGDGALIAIPGDFVEEVQEIINTCVAIASESFGLTLAAGIVSMEELYKQNIEFSVAKIYTSENVTQAAFMGDGVFRAEEIVKERPAKTEALKKTEVNLSGLECRWNYFPARKEAISIIVQAIGEDSVVKSEIYKHVLAAIEEIYGGEMDLKPIRLQDMKLTLSPKMLMAEIKMRSKPGFLNRSKYALYLFYMQTVGYVLMKFDITTKYTRWGDYKPDFIKNSDYRKFSGDLKMIVTGNPDQNEKLKELLENLFREKKLVYGMHLSNATITTCFVTEYQSNHIHFIDGADGGYTQASVDFKKRLSEIIR